MQQDWQSSVVYQIYPKSFSSHQGKATGDILGIVDRLDYLQWLGVDYLWLTPIYASPQKDNGYDVSDYYAIDPAYGSMADFDLLLSEAKARGLRIMLDIVVNHSSVQHAWFQEALKGRDNPYRDFYIWRDQPNNWQSKFGGPAWALDPASGQYYLHLFDESQADLNWENPKLRQAVFEMMQFWADKGVAGFRLDVINLISKQQDFSDDESDGRRFYTDGPRVHEYLQEMHRAVFAGRDLLTVGEMSSTTLPHCIQYSRPDRHELSMTFNFHHLKVDYPNGEKWVAAPYDFIELKRILSDWQSGMNEGGGWNAIFWCNHDQPRVVSRFGDDGEYRLESAKMLATTLHGLQGTPYIYQGEEIGMANPAFSQISDYRDVETLNAYQNLSAAGVPEAGIMAAIKQKSRDNSRTPMQWNDGLNAGFSSAEPWIGIASQPEKVNVAAAMADQNSVLHHYRQLIALRKTSAALKYGEYQCLSEQDAAVWAYTRSLPDEILLIVSNFSASEADFSLPPLTIPADWAAEVLLANYEHSTNDFKHFKLRPYESLLIRFSPS
ncbi:alpha,alpha-phosphotrehalase [Janthinobacterium sp. B9-8]|uniref:alpha,alpha-phosphotrehalase n=1 Tax=Janthinobacterium sp. B9-8 TaxID=1236179 RepID=UPI00061D12E1|nr:alpha,alpha-phosphotrehalase [Janthinobacterium sp. B9-8]AMC35751.1 glucohydrolase [Janthinobacterium sp. B9-8]